MDSQSRLSQKEKFDACMVLSDHFVQHFETRRNYEWKIAFGVWTLLGAACVTLRGKQGLPAWLLIAVVAFFEICWLWNIWRRNRKDKEAHRHYRKQAESILSDPSHVFIPFVFDKNSEEDEHSNRIADFLLLVWLFLTDWAMLFQGVTTAVLAWAAYYFNHI